MLCDSAIEVYYKVDNLCKGAGVKELSEYPNFYSFAPQLVLKS